MKAVTALLLCLLAGVATACPEAPDAPDCAPAEALAETVLPAPAYAAGLRADIGKVLQGPDFKRKETVRRLGTRDWLRRLLQAEPEPQKAAPGGLPDWLGLVASLFKYLAIGVLLAALGWLLWHGWQWLSPQTTLARAPRKTALVVEALALPVGADQPLPPDVPAAAEAAWARGDLAHALSLLYRGALAALEAHYRLPLPASATEGECLRLARRSGKPVVEAGFAPLVRAWQAEAYAGRAPADFSALLALYRQHFATGAAP